MEQLETKYGKLKGISTIEHYKNGGIKECILNEPNIISTKIGDFIPKYEDDGVRSKYIKSVSFYESGDLKSIYLQEQCSVSTSIGQVPAELLTFYENGNLKRIFPLNGKITGYWTEENEYELAKELEIHFPFAEFRKKIINVLFYVTGEIKSVTLWSKEKVKVETSLGNILVRIGFSVYPDGKLKSCEPAFPTIIDTVIGTITAYDVNATGVNADLNSLCFYEDGRVKSLFTSTDSIEIIDSEEKSVILMPGLKPSLLNENGMDILPMKIEFQDAQIIIDNGKQHVFHLGTYKFIVRRNDLKAANTCGDCSSCTACG